MKEKELSVEVLGELDLTKLNKTFYEILFKQLLILHEQQDNSMLE